MLPESGLRNLFSKTMERSDITVSIVIPTYNEELNVVRLLKQTHEMLTRAGYTHELIVVDDRGTDNTRAAVKALRQTVPEVVLIERDTERGLASAVVRGYHEARGRYLGGMDADLAHDPRYLPKMLDLLEKRDADFVIGSRYLPDSQFLGKPLINKLASIVGQWLIKRLLGVRVNDTSNNYRVFTREVWEKIKNRLHPDGNIMLTEMVYLAEKNNFRLREVPIIYQERRLGKSKLHIAEETMRFFKNIGKIKRGR